MQPEGQQFLNLHGISDAEIEENLAAADLGLLCAVLSTLTGDLRWTQDPYRAESVNARQAHYDGTAYEVAPSVRAEVLDAALEVLVARRDDPSLEISRPTLQHITSMMEMVTAEEPGEGYAEKLVYDLRFEQEQAPLPENHDLTIPKIVIIGAGMSGLNMGMRLKDAGFKSFTLLDKNADLGGTWHENSYPDCGVDTNPHLYDWAIEPNPEWSRYDTKRDEILQYIKDAADRRALRDMIQFDTMVSGLTYDPARSTWTIDTVTPEGPTAIEADVVITAVGTLNWPKTPDIPGLSEFQGTFFHTADWRHDVDFEGQRIGLIGNGSSGVQVARSLSSLADLFIFQRSPAWIAPRRSAEFSPVPESIQWLLRHLPLYAAWHRFAQEWEFGDRVFPILWMEPDSEGTRVSPANDELRQRLKRYMQSELGERQDLVPKLEPDYPPYAKRMVIDNDWYRTLTRPNVELVSDEIVSAYSGGLVTGSGQKFGLDVLIFATGFHGSRFLYPMTVVGADGRSLEDHFGTTDDARAYLGVAMPGFPNLYHLQGPNSAAGYGGSATYVSECQAHYIVECLKLQMETGSDSLEVRAEVSDAYNVDVDAGLAATVWSYPVRSRYKNPTGRVVGNHAWKLEEFWKMTRVADPEHFTLKTSAEPAEPVSISAGAHTVMDQEHA